MNKILKLNQQGWRGNFGWLENLEKIVTKRLRVKKEISIVLMDKVGIQELNKVYRQQNKPTDVLSFNIDTPQILGEIVICPDIAKENATADKKSYKDELKLLTVHGILHLLGYDHERSQKEKARQEAKEKIILNELAKLDEK